MATHSSILAWRIPWAEEPGGLQSMESETVRHEGAMNTLTFFKFCSMAFTLPGQQWSVESEPRSDWFPVTDTEPTPSASP